jgi:hypothetical protein
MNDCRWQQLFAGDNTERIKVGPSVWLQNRGFLFDILSSADVGVEGMLQYCRAILGEEKLMKQKGSFFSLKLNAASEKDFVVSNPLANFPNPDGTDPKIIVTADLLLQPRRKIASDRRKRKYEMRRRKRKAAAAPKEELP